MSDDKAPRMLEKQDDVSDSLSTTVRDEGLWRELWQQIRLVWFLLRDPEVPLYLKLLPVVAVVYTLVPADLVPDIFPFLGQLDDITALLVGGKVFIEMAPPHVVARYMQAMRLTREDERGTEEQDLNEAIVIEGEVIEGESEASE
ncbi:MAG: DUF1232 domain-containing protein [Candidatus Promineifilaceae bacterium]|nr:DUF1232 domain-containing protein [Candidatus Promineifilaceae bacterium]